MHSAFASCVARALIGGAVALGACASGSGAMTPDAEPIVFKEPPRSKDGTATVPACNGVPQRGECQQGVAVYCDLEAQALRRIECGALAPPRQCVMDAGRGAVCEDVTPSLDSRGICIGDTAVWFDPQTQTPQKWDCGDFGLACKENDCQPGAYCCPPAIAPQPNACGDLDFYGYCDVNANAARYCQNGTPVELSCADRGQRCRVDVCAYGAYCCDTDPDECATVGYAGVCVGNVIRFCSEDKIIELECPSDRPCRENVCYAGAACCP